MSKQIPNKFKDGSTGMKKPEQGKRVGTPIVNKGEVQRKRVLDKRKEK